MIGLCGFLVCKPIDKEPNGFYWVKSQQGGRDREVTSYKSYKGPYWESNSLPTGPWTPAWQLPIVPQRHSHQLRVSRATINQPLRGGQREEKLKRGKGGVGAAWGDCEGLRGEWLYSSSARKQWDTCAPSKCSALPSFPLQWGLAVWVGGVAFSVHRPHRETIHYSVRRKAGAHFCPFTQPKMMKSNLYS